MVKDARYIFNLDQKSVALALSFVNLSLFELIQANRTTLNAFFCHVLFYIFTSILFCASAMIYFLHRDD